MANQEESQEKQTVFQEKQQVLDEEQLQEITGGGNALGDVFTKIVSCCDKNFTNSPRRGKLIRSEVLHTQDGTYAGESRVYTTGPVSPTGIKAGLAKAKANIHELGLRTFSSSSSGE